MSMDGLMRTSVSGMQAQSNRLGAVAGNIANASTVGYKRIDTQFATLLVDAPRTSAPSMGVETAVRHVVSKQGLLQATSSRFDLAINGNGFLVVAGSDGQPVLTRAGAFVPDGDGKLVSAAGHTLLGTPVAGDGTAAGLGLADLVPVVVRSGGLEATPSTSATLSANLPASAAPIAAGDLPTVNGATSASTARASVITYGNLGETITLDVHFARTATASDWEVSVFNAADRPATGEFPYASGPLATATLAFDGFGNIGGASATSVVVTPPGGSPVTIDFARTTQLAVDFTVLDVGADGNPASPVSSVEIDGQGIVSQVYGNGTRKAIFQIPLAAVASPDNLEALDRNTYRASSASGDVRVATAGSAGLGALISGALESSTVDLASELTDMISAQRNYTANSRVFQTGSEIMDVIVNLKR